MGWTLYYQLIRSRPLDATETQTLADEVARLRADPWESEPFALEVPTEARPDGIVARGATKVPYLDDEDGGDAQRVIDALNALARMFAAEARLEDDLETITRDPDTGELALGIGDNEPLLDADDGAWRDAASPDAPAAHTPIAAREPPADPLGREAREELVDRRSSLGALGAGELFLIAWTTPENRYWWADMVRELGPELCRRVASVSDVVTHLVRDLRSARGSYDETECRRAAEAVRLLACSSRAEALIALVEEARWQRTCEHAFDYEHRVRHAMREALATIAEHPLAREEARLAAAPAGP